MFTSYSPDQGEVFADDADHLHRGKETGRHRCMTRRAAEQLWVFARGSLDGIQGRRTDNQYAHKIVVESDCKSARTVAKAHPQAIIKTNHGLLAWRGAGTAELIWTDAVICRRAWSPGPWF